jgi:hypothetical protein
VAEGRIEKTVLLAFFADETADVNPEEETPPRGQTERSSAQLM